MRSENNRLEKLLKCAEVLLKRCSEYSDMTYREIREEIEELAGEKYESQNQ